MLDEKCDIIVQNFLDVQDIILKFMYKRPVLQRLKTQRIDTAHFDIRYKNSVQVHDNSNAVRQNIPIKEIKVICKHLTRELYSL